MPKGLGLFRSKNSKVQETLPSLPEVWIAIFKEVGEFSSVLQFRLVCKFWCTVADTNDIWSYYAKMRWPTVRISTRIRNWQRFFSNRYKAEVALLPIESHPIENCYEFEFKCPLMMENLRPLEGTTDTLVCEQCSNLVKVVTTMEEMEWECAQGNCITFIEPERAASLLPTSTADVNPIERKKLNCVVVGDPKVGKSSITRRFYQAIAESQHGKAALTPVGDGCMHISLFEPSVDINIYEPQLSADELNQGLDAMNHSSMSMAQFSLMEYETGTEAPDLQKTRNKVMAEAQAQRKEKKKILGVDPEEVSVFLVCFSVVDRKSYHNALNTWWQISRWASARNAKVILMGLKTDLRAEGFIGNLLNSHVKWETANAKASCRTSIWSDYVECEQGTDMYAVFSRITQIAFAPASRRLGGCVVL
mmetsp:Transcript_10838/g.13380  ORF Transcript_10838/g.13380 Transcript_10838/m.13380 type:complete len:420 (-) Transcript_10838:17-1276(-)